MQLSTKLLHCVDTENIPKKALEKDPKVPRAIGVENQKNINFVYNSILLYLLLHL